jgi:hypothetical protein
MQSRSDDPLSPSTEIIGGNVIIDSAFLSLIAFLSDSRGLRLSYCATPKQLAGERARRFAVFDRDLTVHQHRVDTDCLLDQPWPPVGQVELELRHARCDRLWVEDDHVGLEPFFDPAPVLQAPDLRNIAGELADCLLDAEPLRVAHPM